MYYSQIYYALLNCFFEVSIGLISVDKGVEHFKAEDIVALHVRNNECMLQHKKD